MTPMSTNNSNCWCSTIVLGPTNTSVTCSAVLGTTGVKEQHQEDGMHLQSCESGPGVSSVYRRGSTPMDVRLMQLLAASFPSYVTTVQCSYIWVPTEMTRCGVYFRR